MSGGIGMGRTLVVQVDNQGTVSVYGKGRSSKCRYSTTIARATFEVAKGLGMEVRVCKIRRCSDKGSILADALSKGRVREFRVTNPDFRLLSVPSSILDWVSKPVVDYTLGRRILCDMRRRGIKVMVEGDATR